MIILRALRGAERDLEGALTWYRRQGGIEVAQAFADDYRRALQRAVQFPRSGRRLTATTSRTELRCVHFKRFRDYYLVLAVYKRGLVLVAVASSKRRYGYWKPRLAKANP